MEKRQSWMFYMTRSSVNDFFLESIKSINGKSLNMDLRSIDLLRIFST